MVDLGQIQRGDFLGADSSLEAGIGECLLRITASLALNSWHLNLVAARNVQLDSRSDGELRALLGNLNNGSLFLSGVNLHHLDNETSGFEGRAGGIQPLTSDIRNSLGLDTGGDSQSYAGSLRHLRTGSWRLLDDIAARNVLTRFLLQLRIDDKPRLLEQAASFLCLFVAYIRHIGQLWARRYAQLDTRSLRQPRSDTRFGGNHRVSGHIWVRLVDAVDHETSLLENLRCLIDI